MDNPPTFLGIFATTGCEFPIVPKLYRRMKPLGATPMTGGSNPFYEKIGYHPTITWTMWRKL